MIREGPVRFLCSVSKPEFLIHFPLSVDPLSPPHPGTRTVESPVATECVPRWHPICFFHCFHIYPYR